jgi:hypothetical protein
MRLKRPSRSWKAYRGKRTGRRWAFGNTVKNTGTSILNKTGMWVNSKFEDMAQDNGSFKTKFRRTPRIRPDSRQNVNVPAKCIKFIEANKSVPYYSISGVLYHLCKAEIRAFYSNPMFHLFAFSRGLLSIPSEAHSASKGQTGGVLST